MSRFRIEQTFDAAPDDVARAYADPALYGAFTALPRAGAPMVLDHDVAGHVVELRIRWSFTAELSGAARAVIDPERLSWVEESRHDLVRRRTSFRMVPDHYGERFACSGEARVDPAPAGGARRVVEGELRVKAPLVGRAVEGAIISGLEDQLRHEVPVVQKFLG